MSHPVRITAVPALLAFALFGLAGCSDQSRYVMSITQIVPSFASVSDNTTSLEADLVGNFSASGCQTVQDMATVTVRVEHPGSGGIGPYLGAWLTSYRVDYFYYDPITGSLAGPVTSLTTTSAIRIQAGAQGSGFMTANLDVPIGTYDLKAWSVGASRNGRAGYAGAVPGSVWVERVVARVSVTGEDTTGKILTAEGSMLVHLDNYGPGPDPFGLSPPTSANWCYGVDKWTFWRTYGGVQP